MLRLDFNRRLSLLLSCLLFALLFWQRDARLAAPTIQPELPAAPLRQEFITYQTAAGSETRLATVAETQYLAARQPVEAEPWRATFNARLSAPNSPRDGFLLSFRGSAQLARYPEAQAAYDRALLRWQELFAPEGASFASIEVDVDFGTEFFGLPFAAPGIIGITSVPEVSVFYEFALERLIENSFDAEKSRLYSFLPTQQIPTELGAAQLVNLSAAHAAAVRLRGGLSSPAAIGFNAATPFDFEPRDGIAPGKLDFEAAVLRELGRVLGFISRVGEVGVLSGSEPRVSFWDLFRFRVEADPNLTAAALRSERRPLLSGGAQVFFIGDELIPLSTGGGNGQLGDGNPAGSWKDDALTGRYLGVFDPTLAAGERGGFTANDLRAVRALGYNLNEYAAVMEVLAADDGSREASLPVNGALLVNRLTPARLPATVDAVRVQLPDGAEGAATGQALRVVLFADPARRGQPPANPQWLYDRTFTLGNLPAHRMLEIMLDKPVTLAAGDLYVGIQTASSQVCVGADRNGAAQGRAFISRDNGASFEPLQLNQQPLNLLLRAVCQEDFLSAQTPQIGLLSPAAAPPGSMPFELFVYGNNFAARQGSDFSALSVVRWNGQPRPTDYVNGTLLKATIPQADLAQAGTARVTVFTPDEKGGRESAPVEFSISPLPVTPTLVYLTPDFATPGSEAATLTLRGRNLTSSSVARWNGQARTTRFIDHSELRVSLNAADFAAAATAEVTVFTPNPGAQTEGKSSNALRFRVAPCNYKAFAPEQSLSSFGGSARFLLETEPPCSWALSSEATWLRLVGTGEGRGRSLVAFNVSQNSDGPPRQGALKIAGQTLNVRQIARLAGTSAANYNQNVAIDSIGTLFGQGLAKRTQAAERLPLPTALAGTQVRVIESQDFTYQGFTRHAALFFVSPGQLNFHLPATVYYNDDPNTTAGKSAKVEVFVDGQLAADGFLSLSRISSDLFTATAGGQGAAVGVALRIKADGTQSYEPLSVFDPARNRVVTNPIDLGPAGDQVFLILYGTGFRARPSLSSVKATINAAELEVLYAGPQGDLVGLDQVNLRVPRRYARAGEVRLRFSVNEAGGSLVLVAFK